MNYLANWEVDEIADEVEVVSIKDIDDSYAVVPAVKIGKLAVNHEVSDTVKRKGYGSFMIEVARGIATDLLRI